MKKAILLLITSLFFVECSNNENSSKNPYISNYNFSVDLNLNLPLYSNLKSPGNGIYYSNAGVKGIFVFNTGTGYNAFDAACPNQEISSCTAMTLKGINALCSCDSKEYNLFTGQGDASVTYPMKQYRVQVISETQIRIYN
jgi:nitrite reductase/ring-hydroxylating ferredoxin subunit